MKKPSELGPLVHINGKLQRPPKMVPLRHSGPKRQPSSKSGKP